MKKGKEDCKKMSYTYFPWYIVFLQYAIENRLVTIITMSVKASLHSPQKYLHSLFYSRLNNLLYFNNSDF